MGRLRTLASGLARTPLHPQWLMPRQAVAAGIRGCRGQVLDIGAGNRWVQQQLHPDARYVAFDYPATAQGLYGTRPDVFGDACRLPFMDACMDAVTCYEVLEHVRAPDAVLAEVARVLRPGGVAEFTMPFLYPLHDEPYDFQRWTAHGWTRSAGAAGLQVLECSPLGHPLHAAAVLGGLALTGPLSQASPAGVALRLPLAAVLVAGINLAAWLLAKAWPRWDAMATRYRVLVVRP